MARTFLEQLAQPRPDPGGGAASAHAAAIGVALLEKVVLLEIQRKDSPQRDHLQIELAEIRGLSSVLSKIQEKDCEAYLRLAYAKASGTSRRELEAAVEEAVACPSEIIETGARALASLSRLGGECKTHLAADLQVACELLAAAIMGSYHIATANLSLFADESEIARRRLYLSARLDSVIKQLQTVRQELVLRTRMRFRRR